MLRFRGALCCGRSREALPSPARILLPFLVPAIATVALVAVYPSPAQAARRRPVAARTIVRRIDRGRAVRESHVEVRGTLHLPRTVSAPLVIRDSKIDGSISGTSTTFDGVLNLSGTEIAGSLDLPDGDFGGPVLLAGTKVDGGAGFDFSSFDQSALVDEAAFDGAASFEGTLFRGPAHFSSSTFAKRADFRFADFGDLGIFEITQFVGPSSFANAEFRSTADFDGAGFFGRASFKHVRFFDGAEYFGGHFASAAAFDFADFEGDTTFRRRIFQGSATFTGATAAGLLDFDGAQFSKTVDFRTSQLEDAEFSGGEKQTKLMGPVLFDQASVDTLDLDGAEIDSNLLLPDPRGIGGIENLRMDPADVDRIRAVKSLTADSGTPRYGTRAARKSALALIETAARSGGDLAAADAAEVHRLTLERRGASVFYVAASWGLGWQIGGYLVRPLHPLVALIVFLVLVALARSWNARGASDRRGLERKLRGFRSDLRTAISALWTFDPAEGGFRRLCEQLVTKLLLVAFVLSIGNVEPGLSPIVKGVLP